MSRTRTAFFLPVLLAVACVRTPPATVAASRRSPIDTMALRAHTAFLADDLLRGRGTGTREADIAAACAQADQLAKERAARRVGEK